MPGRSHSAVPVESALQVFVALFAAQACLRRGIASAPQCVCQQRKMQSPAGVGGHFIGLVKPPFQHAHTVQWNRDQHAGQRYFMHCHVCAQQVTQYPAGRQLALVLEGLYQAVGGKLVKQGANGACKWWWVADAGAANFIPGGTQRQTATETVWAVPG